MSVDISQSKKLLEETAEVSLSENDSNLVERMETVPLALLTTVIY